MLIEGTFAWYMIRNQMFACDNLHRRPLAKTPSLQVGIELSFVKLLNSSFSSKVPGVTTQLARFFYGGHAA